MSTEYTYPCFLCLSIQCGRSPLHEAASNGHASFVHLLLDRGADVNAEDRVRRLTCRTELCLGTEDTCGLHVGGRQVVHIHTSSAVISSAIRCMKRSTVGSRAPARASFACLSFNLLVTSFVTPSSSMCVCRMEVHPFTRQLPMATQKLRNFCSIGARSSA